MINSLIYHLRANGLLIVIIIGTVFNTFLFFIMRRVKSATSFYMSILALVDTGKLIKYNMTFI
jgi:hypothetical protein